MRQRTTYRRAHHAAHYGNGMGHDLEQWDVTAKTMPEAHAIGTSEGMPSDARYHSGYRTNEGEQHWLFTRVAPLGAGYCEHCEPSEEERARRQLSARDDAKAAWARDYLRDG